MQARRNLLQNAGAGAYSELSKMGRLADNEIPRLLKSSGQQSRAGMCEVMNETNARRHETGLVKVRQQRLQRNLSELRASRLEPAIEENGTGIALASHRHEAGDLAVEAKKHQPGILEYRRYIHSQSCLAREFQLG